MQYSNYIKNLLAIVLFIGIAVFGGCNDAKYSELDIHAYIEESLSGAGTVITVESEGETATTLTVHISNLSSVDNHYWLEPDQSAQDNYNRLNGTSLKMLPETHYTLPEDITVKAGQYESGKVDFSIHAFSQEMIDSGESYALALKLRAKEGSIPAMENTGSYVVVASNILKFSAPMFVGSAELQADKFKTSPETYGEYTIEVRFQISNTANRNRAVFNNTADDGGLSNVLLRFEDPQSNTNDHKKHSLVQIVGRNSIYMNPSYSFETNKWQHLALTCDGSNYRLYINGQFAGVKEIPSGPTTFSSVMWFTGNSWWGDCRILMSEARMWSVARTELQIQNNMTVVSPQSPGLEAYWRFNEGKGNVFEDVTGKGHTLTTTKTPQWIHGILSTDEATPWE